MSNQFFVLLPSNTRGFDDENRPNHFRVQLPKTLDFFGNWLCGLHSISFAYSWPTSGTTEAQWVEIYLREGQRIRLPIPTTSFTTIEQIEENLQKIILLELEKYIVKRKELGTGRKRRWLDPMKEKELVEKFIHENTRENYRTKIGERREEVRSLKGLIESKNTELRSGKSKTGTQDLVTEIWTLTNTVAYKEKEIEILEREVSKKEREERVELEGKTKEKVGDLLSVEDYDGLIRDERKYIFYRERDLKALEETKGLLTGETIAKIKENKREIEQRNAKVAEYQGLKAQREKWDEAQKKNAENTPKTAALSSKAQEFIDIVKGASPPTPTTQTITTTVSTTPLPPQTSTTSLPKPSAQPVVQSKAQEFIDIVKGTTSTAPTTTITTTVSSIPLPPQTTTTSLPKPSAQPMVPQEVYIPKPASIQPASSAPSKNTQEKEEEGSKRSLHPKAEEFLRIIKGPSSESDNAQEFYEKATNRSQLSDKAQEFIERVTGKSHDLEFTGENVHLPKGMSSAKLTGIAKAINFKFLRSLNKFQLLLDAGAGIEHIALSSQIGYILGFENSAEIRNEEIAKYSCDLKGGINSICVFVKGLTENIIMGNELVSLLRVVTVSGSYGDIIEKIYDSPIYTRVLPRQINEIEIELRTLEGRLVPFQFGTTIITLVFKKTINL